MTFKTLWLPRAILGVRKLTLTWTKRKYCYPAGQYLLLRVLCFRLRVKIKTIGEKFETREVHYKSLLRSKDAEIQSLTAKYEEQRRAAENEAARCRALSSQVSTFSHTEAELRSQLNIYVEKFKQVWIEIDDPIRLWF
ncbi:unnamed protein product [Aspergillus oryzae]|uniref:Unnamed protein product n=1 Tax=Aspergillus oryzae TaxID=5062 RepID=A0AAN5BT66_ASPOZ|nr:unnamed protein product [Aspergillus oryzae]